MVRLTGKVLDIYRDEGTEAIDGDVWLQPKLDSAGHAAVAGRHANQGYSGWFAGLIQAEGGRRRFLSWKILFADMQNGYRLQSDKHSAVFRIEECLKVVLDMEIVKATGGWRFADEAEAERRIGRHWEDWKAPKPGMTRDEAQAIADRMNRKTVRRYTADEILARPESEFEKRKRLRGIVPLGLGRSSS